MRAMLCTAFTGADGLQMGEADDPAPADDEVLVDVHAASVTFADCLMMNGGYQVKPDLPYVPGSDVAGVVRAVGKNVTHFKVGDRAAGGNWYGGFAEQSVIKESKSVRIPDGVEDSVACTVVHNYGTVYYGLVVKANVQPGESVFITGAAGGVGLAAIDMARKLGARIIAGIGSDDKADVVRHYGATEVINYQTEDLRQRIDDLTNGNGVDVCFDNVGGEVFKTMARRMAWDGRLLICGFTSGEIPEIKMNLPLLKNYAIIGLFAGPWLERFPKESRVAQNTIMQWLADGELHPHIDRILPLKDAAEAVRLIADRKAQGRIVLQVK